MLHEPYSSHRKFPDGFIINKESYARGELSREQYEQLLSDLK